MNKQKGKQPKVEEISKKLTLVAEKAGKDVDFLGALKKDRAKTLKEYGFDPKMAAKFEVIVRESCSCGCPYPGYGIGCFIPSGEGAKTSCW